jgi:hypothetical protein
MTHRLPVDHLVYATPDLATTVDELEQRLGVRASPGGQHAVWGTCNAIISLGDRVYLELLGPDPNAPPPALGRPLGVSLLMTPVLLTWAAAATNLEALVASAATRGEELGEVMTRTRERPDGSLISWTMTDLAMPRADGIVPFFIDWGEAPHPAASAVCGGALVGLRAEHPNPARVVRQLQALGLDLDVRPADPPALIASLDTPLGLVELR